MRLNYPVNIKVLRVPCTGKVDVIHMLRAFEKGADGVSLVGCMEGNCAFEHGNFRAKKRVAKVAAILDSVGIGGGRVRMYNLSSGDAPLFAQYAREMTENILALGPSPARARGAAGQGAAAANAA
jgi:F420-non-reducing hydrogenase iron-sulfur subunit